MPVLAQAAPPPPLILADTSVFPLNYCTALPTLDFVQWKKDYARYERFLTPEIRRTQVGLSFSSNGLETWRCQPSASPHAQLDPLTRLIDPARLVGRWQTLASRTVVHRDSAVLGKQRFYRSVRARDNSEHHELLFADGKLSVFPHPTNKPPREPAARCKYAVVSGRYLLTYGLLKAGGAVRQVGMARTGRLILHSCSVTGRKVRGRYLTYETVLNQAILERLPQ